MIWSLLVLFLVLATIAAYRNIEANKDLEQSRQLMQCRIRTTLGKDRRAMRPSS